MLKLNKVYQHYGLISVLKDLTLEVRKGEIVTLLGCNGAGKTTTLRAISGMIPITSGEIHLEDKDLKPYKVHERVGLGLVHSPEGRMVFPGLTVKENLEMGAYLRRDKEQIKSDMDFGLSLFPRLKERLSQNSGTLSGGEQQMLAIARALMGKPKMLLLDEPSLGIAPMLVQSIFKSIQEINREKKLTILLVEQNAFLALKVAHRGYVLETGQIQMQGLASDLLKDPKVKEAYLGVS